MTKEKTTKPAKTPTKRNPTWKVKPLPKENLYVNSVAISADGSKVVGGNYYHKYGSATHTPVLSTPFKAGMYAFDKTGTQLFSDEFMTGEGVYWVDISRDGSWYASGGLMLNDEGFVCAYSMATGSKALNYNTHTRVNEVILSDDGSCLVAGADALYFFTRGGLTWTGTPQKITLVQPNDTVKSVDISGDGKWIVAATSKGSVMLVENNAGILGTPLWWKAPSTLNYIAMSTDGSSFAVCPSNANLYFFSVTGFQAAQAPAWTATGCTDWRWAAITDDGSLVSTVGTSGGGKLFLFANNGAAGQLKWSVPTLHSPNSTSMDANGKFVSVADGHPDGSPGAFTLYDANGNLLWSFATNNMNWPMYICDNASAIATGSDDGYICYFSLP